MNAIDCLNFPYHQSSKPHCQKCGRRNRSDNTCKNNRQGNNQLKYQRQQRLFPTELLPYPIVNPTNDNHFISKNIHSRKNQVIQVQPLNTINYYMDNDYKIDVRDTMNSNILKRVQQMIYLRENINK